MAKIIGVLHGKERSFPEALVKKINEKNIKDISAAPVKIDKVIQGDPSGYAVIIDRISQDVPFYRAFLKNAAISGTAVINNPFWWSADEKFFNNALASSTILSGGVPMKSSSTMLWPPKLGCPYPRRLSCLQGNFQTILQPSHFPTWPTRWIGRASLIMLGSRRT